MSGIALAILTGALALAFASSARAQASLEYAVKAAFLTRFAAFTDWPPGALEQASALRICVVGRDPFGEILDRAAEGIRTAGRTVAVVRLPAVTAQSGCHIVYVGGSRAQTPVQVLEAVRGRPVLTVTDADRGGARGMIHFVVFQDRVRFHADLGQAQRSGVGLSSKLLALALTVKR